MVVFLSSSLIFPLVSIFTRIPAGCQVKSVTDDERQEWEKPAQLTIEIPS